MQFFPAALQNLADQFARLPGIGGKTAQRLAFHVLSLPMEDAEEFAQAILEKEGISGKRNKYSIADLENKENNQTIGNNIVFINSV